MAALRVMLASSPNTAAAKARRTACRRRSRSSCASTRKSSNRFSPMVNNRRATCLVAVARGTELAVDSAITPLIVVAIATAGGQIANHRADSQGNGHGLIRMLTHGLIGCFGALDRLVADLSGDFLRSLQSGGQTLAGVPDFFPG